MIPSSNVVLFSLDAEFSSTELLSKCQPEDKDGLALTDTNVFQFSNMLSFGCVPVLYDKKKWIIADDKFYVELKPITPAYEVEAMEIAALGLNCLKNKPDLVFHPGSQHFDPEKVLSFMKRSVKTVEPEKAMPDFEKWVETVTPRSHYPVLAAAPLRADVRFLDLYLNLFGSGNTRYQACQNVFGYGGIDMGSLLKGKRNSLNAHINDLSVPQISGIKHNALYDATMQAHALVQILND